MNFRGNYRAIMERRTVEIKEKVNIVLLDGRVGTEIEKTLERLAECTVLPIRGIEGARDETLFHPDIFFHFIKKVCVCAPNVPPEMRATLSKAGYEVISGNSVVKPEYKYEVAYNAARVGNTVFHNLRYTDPVLKDKLLEAGCKFVHVNQGYTKCSVSIINDKAIITADKGIAEKANENDIEALLINEDQGITLDDAGRYQGFIGGATGIVDSKWLVAGDAKKLKDYEKIREFLEKNNVVIVSLGRGKVKDVGSIMVSQRL